MPHPTRWGGRAAGRRCGAGATFRRERLTTSLPGRGHRTTERVSYVASQRVQKGETLELLFTPQRTTAGEATGYGIGWRIARETLGHRFVSHGGGSVGGTTPFGVDRDSRVVFALVTNLSGAPLGPAREIRAVFDSAASAR
ncbi:MAG: serine hydrolase [Gemmatimonadales bacterium]